MIVEVAAIAAATAAFLTAIGVIWQKGVKPVAAFIKHIASIWEAVETIEERSRQLMPNHGSHLSDDIKEVRRLLETQGQVLEAHVTDSYVREARLWRAMSANPNAMLDAMGEG